MPAKRLEGCLPWSERPWAAYFDDRWSANGECWEYTGKRDHNGYGLVYDGRLKGGGSKYVIASRRSWEMWNRQMIQDGMVTRHTCDNPPCINPAHLLIGTPKDNTQDMISRGRHFISDGSAQKAKTHCPKGHPYSGYNLRLVKGGTARSCRTCDLDNKRIRRLERKESETHA